MAGHMTSCDAAKLAVESNTNCFVLTHLPHHGELRNLVLEAKKIFKGKVLLAKYGLTIEI